MKYLNKFRERIKNPTTIIGITGYVLAIISAMGIHINNEVVLTIIQSICAICVLLGILNNPENPGRDFSNKKKK